MFALFSGPDRYGSDQQVAATNSDSLDTAVVAVGTAPPSLPCLSRSVEDEYEFVGEVTAAPAGGAPPGHGTG
jgi:hypothetical protein